MLRNSTKSRTMLQGVKCIRRYSTQDWEGVHGYAGDTKMPFTVQQSSSASKSSSSSQTSKTAPMATSTPPTNEETRTELKVKMKKTTIEKQDEEIRDKLEAISGGGGEAGVQIEDGKNVGLRRGVRENMFRVI